MNTDTISPNFGIKQNDTAPNIMGILKDENDEVIDISGASVRFHMSDYAGEEVMIDAEAAIEDAENGVVYYDWQEGDTAEAGEFKAEFEVTYSDGKVETFPNEGYIIIAISEEVS